MTSALSLAIVLLAAAPSEASAEKPELKPKTIRVAGPEHLIVPAYERFHAAKTAGLDEGGRLLLGELNCTSCHAVPSGLGEWILPKKAPILTDVGDRIRSEWIRQMLDDPQRVKPGTTMPDLFADLTRQDKAHRVEALTHFLVSTATEAQHDAYVDGAAVKRGEQLFHEVGCAACHNSQKRGAKPVPFAMPLGAPSTKYTHAALAEFLRDPMQVRPSGRMPGLNLVEQDASDIAAYFLRDVSADPNLRYAYYEGKWERLPDFTQLKPLKTGTAAGFDLSVAAKKNDYGLRFEGYLRVEKEERVVMRLRSDDGSKLWVDDLLIVEYDGIHPAGEKEGKTSLAPGVHKVAIDYFQGGGEAELGADIRFAGKQAWVSLASYMTLEPAATKPAAAEFKVDSKLALEGRRIFENFGCASCHELKRDGKALASTLKPPALKDLRLEQGCVVGTTGIGDETKRGGSAVPRYAFSAPQQKSLGAALVWAKESAAAKPQPSAKQKLVHNFAALNCYACHQRDGLGGVDPNKTEDLNDDGIPDRDPTSELLSPLFVGTTPEMGDEGRLPPRLDGVGAKLTEAYLKHVLDKGSKDRPYMKTVMPRFGGGNVLKLVPLLAELDTPITDPLAPLDGPPYRLKGDGRLLVGTKGFGCVKCHQFNKEKAEGIQGIDMTIITKRVRPEWFVKYVNNPQSLRPGTRMPTIFPDGKSPLKETLAGDPQQQIAAMWLFLNDGKDAAVPIGVGGQPIELTADKEPVMYRNFIQGAGPRAIGVGYPSKVNLAFDAQEMRLALLWHGSFIDAAKHWAGRGSGFQGPLGDDVLKFASGPDVAQLKDDKEPWPTKSGRELGYRFEGYKLDETRRPTFLYNVEGIDVTDSFRAGTKEKPGMLRIVSLPARYGLDDYWFRAAAGKQIKPLTDDWYEVDGLYRMRVRGGQRENSEDQKPILRSGPLGKELLVRFRMTEAGGRNYGPQVFQEFDW